LVECLKLSNRAVKNLFKQKYAYLLQIYRRPEKLDSKFMKHHQPGRWLFLEPSFAKVLWILAISMSAGLWGEVGAAPALAKKRFEWTPSLRQAYEAVIHLRFKEAAEILKVTREKDAGNLMQLHVENYLEFLQVYIDENKADFRRLEQNKQSRLRQIEQEGDPGSPYYLYLLADIRLQWAWARIKFGEYPTAFLETNKAFQLLTENSRKFPDFMPNKKDLGILHALAGTIPEQYQWALQWLSSMEGTIQQGKQELQEVMAYSLRQDFIYELETCVYYAYLMLHLGSDLEEAWRAINESRLKPESNPLACFVMANLAMKSGRGEEAIDLLQRRPSGKEFHDFNLLDYLLGLAKLQRLDTDADVHLLRFTANFKGLNFIKDAYQKLAWHSLAVRGNHSGYQKYIALAKEKGAATTDSDKSAQAEAISGLLPAADLLRARLLCDGGNYRRAHEILEHKKASDYLSEKNKIELLYRKGRIANKLNRLAEALEWYRLAIEKGSSSPYYFACRAALETGQIYEKQGKKKSALSAYELCLSISPQEYRTGLHLQAKAGIKRLKS
jgi:predicted negative regulator of RcsB-dependent stress response